MASSRLPEVVSKQDAHRRAKSRSTAATLAVVFVLLGTVAGVIARESNSEAIITMAQTAMMTSVILALVSLISAITRGKSLG